MSLPSESATEDFLLGGRVRLIQPAFGYRAAIDPVLLAAATPARPGETVLDLGLGVGAAALCLARRIDGISVTGIEIQPELAELAHRNAALNGLALRVVVADLAGPLPDLAEFDHVITNPPYLAPGEARLPPDVSKAQANAELSADLDAWLDVSARLLRPKGRLTMIHRADRLDQIIAGLKRRKFGELALFPLWPKAGRPAKRILLSARKGMRGPAKMLPGLVLHNETGGFTAQAEAVLRDSAPIILSDH